MAREEERVLRALRSGACRLSEPAAKGEAMLLERPSGEALRVSRDAVAALLSAGRILLAGTELRLAEESADPLGALLREIAEPGEADGPQRNLAESPLGALMRRKGRDGKPFLSDGEFDAGERLRADFTRGQMMPRLGANWEAAVASGRRGGGGAGGIADLTEAALAARLRVEKAVSTVGPELSGVLLDVCCFLKGLEQVESERGWPVRSAKILLKSALGALARHYRPAEPARRAKHHWGAADFRPRLRDGD